MSSAELMEQKAPAAKPMAPPPNFPVQWEHPSDAGQLPGVGRSMLRLFDDPKVQGEFAKRGLDLNKARSALQKWIDSGGITSYTF